VFVVGYLGDWRAAAAVLFEEGTAGGSSKTGRTVWEEVAAEGGEGSSVLAFPINTQIALRHRALGRGTGFGMRGPGEGLGTDIRIFRGLLRQKDIPR
jgi:hypothetical protein